MKGSRDGTSENCEESGEIDKLHKENQRLHEKIEALQDMLDRTTDYLDRLREDLADSKEALQVKTNHLEDSIRFASLIQDGLIPYMDDLPGFSEHFILHRPKERIGGDLPFVYRGKDRTWILMIDCSGHGIPGAMLTMTAHAYLKDILESYDPPLRPSSLLERLDERMQEQFLRKKKSDPEHGIDLACICIPDGEKYLFFEGARRPLFWMASDSVEEFKGTKRSIGEKGKTFFEEQEIPWGEGNAIYIFSDGYPDQFGGSMNKKFKKKNLLEQIRDVHKFEMNDQKHFLERAFEDWKGEEDQVDDVLVMGFRK